MRRKKQILETGILSLTLSFAGLSFDTKPTQEKTTDRTPKSLTDLTLGDRLLVLNAHSAEDAVRNYGLPKRLKANFSMCQSAYASMTTTNPISAGEALNCIETGVIHRARSIKPRRL